MQTCPVCKSKKIIRYGFQPNKIQKYFCKECKKIFNERVGTMYYRMRLKEKEIKEIVHLFFRGVPVAVIADVKEISEQSVRNVLSKAVDHFDKFEGLKINYERYVPEALQIDEIYIKLQGKRRFWAWIAYDPKNKIIIDFEIGQRDEETLQNLFGRLKRFRKKVKLVLVDAYKPYQNLIKKFLCIKNFKPTTGVINKSRYVKQLKGFLTYGLFGVSRRKVEQKVIHLNLGKKISTALIERLNRDIRTYSPYMKRRSPRMARLISWIVISFKAIRALHNLCKAHYTLSFKSSKNWIKLPVTPFMEANLTQKQYSIKEILSTPIIN